MVTLCHFSPKKFLQRIRSPPFSGQIIAQKQNTATDVVFFFAVFLISSQFCDVAKVENWHHP
jgi:hypothetical protein